MTQHILTYAQLLDRLGDGTKHLLVGNGFSIACDPVFRYASLYEAAIDEGLSERAQAVFRKLGTTNFEAVMRLLSDAHWAALTYGVHERDVCEMLEDLDVVKRTLVQAISKSHLGHSGLVSDQKKEAARRFLNQYHNVFTTNYDLLSYWVIMSEPNGPVFMDGFRSDYDDPDAPYVVFIERLGQNRGLFYLHGALHLYVVSGELRKRCWERTNERLTTLIQAGLEQQEYPLFVAEGAPEQKMEHIQRSGYLWYCYDKLARIASPLVVFGHSLGWSDGHIVQALARNTALPRVAIALRGDADSIQNLEIQAAAERMKKERKQASKRGGPRGSQPPRELEVLYFDADSASVWG